MYRLAVRHGLKGFVRNTESVWRFMWRGVRRSGAFLDRADGRPAGACPGLWSGADRMRACRF
ncbi:MAG: hypothetical protein ACLSUW_07640 [Akkermansia sp.]